MAERMKQWQNTAPQFGTSSLLSSKGRNCGSEQGYHVSRLTVRERAAGLFYFRKGYKLEFSRKNQSGQNQGRYTHFRSRQGLLRTPAARLRCSTGSTEGTGLYMDRLHLTAENDPGWWARQFQSDPSGMFEAYSYKDPSGVWENCSWQEGSFISER